MVLIAGAGSVCARQRAERTAEGVEAILCETLFDRSPQVRLPTPAPTSGYAALIDDAVVTASG